MIWLNSDENLTGSSNETYESTSNLITKNPRIDIHWNDYVRMRISLRVVMKHYLAPNQITKDLRI